MDSVMDVAAWVVAHPTETGVIVAVALAGLALAFVVVRLAGRAVTWLFVRYVAPRPVEDVLTIVAASIATGVSAQGMWRFSGDVLHLPMFLRVLLFSFIEVAMVTSAVRARRNMRENFSAGIDGIAVWALTILTAVLSTMDARSFPEGVFRLAAPLVAAFLWERGMAIERRRIRGTGKIHWRLTPERLLVLFGVAETRDRTAQEVDAHRRLTRVALAAKRAKQLRETGGSERKQRAAFAKLDKAMDAAVEHAGLAVNKDRQEELLAQIAALYNTAALTEAEPVSPWEPPKPESPVPAAALDAVATMARWEGRREASRGTGQTGGWSGTSPARPPAPDDGITVQQTGTTDHWMTPGPVSNGGQAGDADRLPATPAWSNQTRALSAPTGPDRTRRGPVTNKRTTRTAATKARNRTTKQTTTTDQTGGKPDRVTELFPLGLRIADRFHRSGVKLSRRSLQAAFREEGESASNETASELVRQLSKRPPRERQVQTSGTADQTNPPSTDQTNDQTTGQTGPDAPDRTTDSTGDNA